MSTPQEQETIDCFDTDTGQNGPKAGLHDAERRLFPRFLSSSGSLLELGCGEGRVTGYLEEMGHDVTALDVAPNRAKMTAENVPGVSVLTGDAGELPFADDSFDYVVFAHNGIDYLHPLERRRDCLREIRRVLNPDGTLIFSSHNLFWVPHPWEEPFNFLDWIRDRVLTGNVFRRYERVTRAADDETSTYYGCKVSAREQKDILEDLGFRSVTIEPKDEDSFLYTQPWVHYVCQP